MIKHIVAAAIGAIVLAACGGGESPGKSAAGAQVPQPVQAVPAPAAARTVDTCAMLSKADAESVIGPLTADPEAKPPRGSLLGECTYAGSGADSINLAAHPADEFDGTVGYSVKKGEAHAVAGIGDKAFQTPYGLMIQPAGKSYFVVVLVMKGLKIDGGAALEAGKKLQL